MADGVAQLEESKGVSVCSPNVRGVGLSERPAITRQCPALSEARSAQIGAPRRRHHQQLPLGRLCTSCADFVLPLISPLAAAKFEFGACSIHSFRVV